MAKPKLTFYYDIASPFAFMAHHLLSNSPVFSPLEITYTPLLLGGIFKLCGNRAPLEIKNKDKWIDLERKRWAKLFGVPVAASPPDGFPLSTLLIQRTLTAILLSAPEKLVPATDAVWKAFWGEGERNVKRVNEAEGLAAALAGVVGEEAAKDYVKRSSSDEVKKALVGNTQKGFDDGCFGLPYFVATNSEGQTEEYWGFDHLGQVCDYLGLEKPERQGGWRAML